MLTITDFSGVLNKQISVSYSRLHQNLSHLDVHNFGLFRASKMMISSFSGIRRILAKLEKSLPKTRLVWYLSAIEIIDTQVARRGRQYHRNPPYNSKKKNKVSKRKK